MEEKKEKSQYFIDILDRLNFTRGQGAFSYDPNFVDGFELDLEAGSLLVWVYKDYVAIRTTGNYFLEKLPEDSRKLRTFKTTQKFVDYLTELLIKGGKK